MKRLPTLTPAQRRGLLVIEWLLLTGIVAYSIWGRKNPSASTMKVAERREWHSAPVKSFTYAEKEIQVETFPFDPNTADSVALLRLGLPPWMVRNIYKYRARGGRYHSPQQFSRTYGMTGELWKRLGPMVRIGEDFKLLSETRHDFSEPGANSDSATANAANTSSEGGSTGLRYPEKFKTPVKLDLNQTDTNEDDDAKIVIERDDD